MRSRYAAFALGLGEYLVRTLAREHPDRVLPEAELARALAEARVRQRFLGLCIMHASEEGGTGEVLFYARIFEKGADRSLAELSTFVREGGAWRYASGVALGGAALPADPTRMTREELLARAGG